MMSDQGPVESGQYMNPHKLTADRRKLQHYAATFNGAINIQDCTALQNETQELLYRQKSKVQFYHYHRRTGQRRQTINIQINGAGPAGRPVMR
jgi:hypothetical protein